MDAAKVNNFMESHDGYFPNERVMQVREQLLSLSDDKWEAVHKVRLCRPSTAVLLAVFLGFLGVDQFYLGRPWIGVLKALSCSGALIWLVISLLRNSNDARNRNYRVLMNAL